MRGILITSLVVSLLRADALAGAMGPMPMPLTEQDLSRFTAAVRSKSRILPPAHSEEEAGAKVESLLVGTMRDMGFSCEATVVQSIQQVREMHREGRHDETLYCASEVFAVGSAWARDLLYQRHLISDATKRMLDDVALRAGL
jgi:hypothetical protein